MVAANKEATASRISNGYVEVITWKAVLSPQSLDSVNRYVVFMSQITRICPVCLNLNPGLSPGLVTRVTRRVPLEGQEFLPFWST